MKEKIRLTSIQAPHFTTGDPGTRTAIRKSGNAPDKFSSDLSFEQHLRRVLQ